ncbi:hypothetical protein SCALM49S_04794 [Streptomyces californicus]
MREQYVEALLYDWHNQHKLRNQRLDLEYWLTLVPPQQNTVVLGAGTGRVASPLATRPGSRVVAIDLSRRRLARIPAAPGLHPVCADMRRLPLSRTADQVVIPYSTFQLLRTAEDRERALAEAVRIMRPGATLHIDVSSNFDLRQSSDWQLVLSASCEEVSRQPVRGMGTNKVPPRPHPHRQNLPDRRMRSPPVHGALDPPAGTQSRSRPRACRVDSGTGRPRLRRGRRSPTAGSTTPADLSDQLPRRPGPRSRPDKTTRSKAFSVRANRASLEVPRIPKLGEPGWQIRQAAHWTVYLATPADLRLAARH